MKRGTPPQYENIKNTFVKYCERMREQIECIEHDKEWLVMLSVFRMRLARASRRRGRT
jgi:hypothetical protein